MKMAIAGIVAVSVMAAGSAMAETSITRSEALYSSGVKVLAETKRSTDNDGIYRSEKREKIAAGPMEGNIRVTRTEEKGKYGKVSIREIAPNGKTATAEGLYVQ